MRPAIPFLLLATALHADTVNYTFGAAGRLAVVDYGNGRMIYLCHQAQVRSREIARNAKFGASFSACLSSRWSARPERDHPPRLALAIIEFLHGRELKKEIDRE
jgi:hypothetical protein